MGMYATMPLAFITGAIASAFCGRACICICGGGGAAGPWPNCVRMRERAYIAYMRAFGSKDDVGW